MSRRKPRVQVALDGTRYSGNLAQPIVIPNRIYLAAALQKPSAATDRPGAVETYVSKERIEKLPELFQLFGLKPDDWQGLAAKLTLAHVPGFQIGNRRGAPKGRVTGEYIVQLLDGWRAQNPSRSLAAAIKWATKTEPLKDMKAETVRRRYDLARARKKKAGPIIS